MIARSETVAATLATLLGIETKNVTKVVIVLEVNKLAVVRITRHVGIDEGKLTSETKRYRLESAA